jgi:CRP/FNR family transcriptional regulator, cyclic AMP receptor protein
MATVRAFKKGDVLFRQGDSSDRVLRIRAGEIAVMREVGGTSIPLGQVRDGEWLGEMGVIENRSRSAAAHAATDGEAEILTAQQFLECVSNEPALARELILRLSIRLRRIEDRIAGELLPFAGGGPGGAPGGTASDAVVTDKFTILLTAQTDLLRASIGAEPIRVAKLPFLVGRLPVEGESKPSWRPELLIEDARPFRLSRQHFMIARSGGQLLVSDLGSTLGTIVNGQSIGHDFTKDTASLRRGENFIVAGGRDSPFALTVSVN